MSCVVARLPGSVIGLVWSILALAIAPHGAQAQMPPPAVVVDEVQLQSLVRTEPAVGRVVALRSGGVAARVAAPVDAVAVDVGDRVAAGDELVRLDETRLALERELARAGQRIAAAQLEEAERTAALIAQELDRLSRLRGSAAFSRARYEDKVAELDVARSRITAATARLAEAEVQLRYRDTDLADTRIRAPYSGVVTARPVSPGQYVRTGDTVAELVDDGALEIEADIAADRLATLGSEITVRLDDGRAVTVTVRAVVPVENPLTRTRAVRFRFAGAPPEGLAVGQAVTLELPVGAGREAVTIPKDAVIVSRGAHRVFVVQGDEVQPRTIEIGEAIGDRFVVLSGLEPGERVVVRGNERLQPGQKVRVATPPAGGGRGEGQG